MRRIILPALMVCLFTPAAWAEQPCSIPMANWQPVINLRAQTDKLGWTVQSIRADDGCYHVKATDKTGKPVDAEFDPQTLKLLGRSDDDKDARAITTRPFPAVPINAPI